MSHFKNVCQFGHVHGQCRCMGPKVVRNITCPNTTVTQDIWPNESSFTSIGHSYLKPRPVPHGSSFAKGEKCNACVIDEAKHKVGEEDARPMLHNYTAYLCCECFGLVMGKAAQKECEDNA